MSDNQNSHQPLQGHVVFLGEVRFPFGFAAVQRMTLMSKALIHAGFNVTVLCRKGNWKKDQYPNFDYKGVYEGINYYYASKITYKPPGFIERNLQKLKGIFGEYRYLRNLKKNDRIDMAIVSNRAVIHILRYHLMSVIFDFPMVINLVEMASSMQHRNTFVEKINDYVLDKWIMKLFDGALPISDKLMDYYSSISPDKPKLKLPILCDFDKFSAERSKQEHPYFLYCGSIGYRQVIDFIVKAYQDIAKNYSSNLYMIVSDCSKSDVALLENEVNGLFKERRIKLFSNIPYAQLVYLYINAQALLIPLRPTIQDSSRFPHKIGEYLASGNPVITTSVGEIKTYFEDGKTALIADGFEEALFAEKMEYVLKNPEKAKEIGENGRQLGRSNFHYEAHGIRMDKFLKCVSKQS